MTFEADRVEFLGVRLVPSNDDALPGRAKRMKPTAIEQLLMRVTGAPRRSNAGFTCAGWN